jgi:DNA-binding transcriptional ArsR family regulator
MPGDADLARIGALLADRVRAAMLLALLAGRPQSASALAAGAGVSSSLASWHLGRLVDGDLLVVQSVGRHRVYRLANAVADALEGLLLLAPAAPAFSLRQARDGDRLRWARLCYDHLAGSVGVAVTDGLVARGALEQHGSEYVVPVDGRAVLDQLGIPLDRLDRRRRPLARGCMDWSERRMHVAGSLGAALLMRFVELRWLSMQEASRVVSVTTAGRRGLQAWLGLELAGSQT